MASGYYAGNRERERSFLGKLWFFRRYLIIVLTPLLLSPLPLAVQGSESRTAYVVLIMAVYWVTEVCNLAVTALLPIILFPMLGVLKSNDVTMPYFKDTNALFLGGLMVAVAIEHVHLHRRIALRVLLIVGAQPRRLMLGFMLTTAFLSMWISNTATTAMMLPIAQAVLGELRADQLKRQLDVDEEEHHGIDNHEATQLQPKEEEEHVEMGDIAEANGKNEQELRILTGSEEALNVQGLDDAQEQKYRNLTKCLILSIAYSANVGGTGTLMGTTPNLVLNGLAEELFPESPGVGFATWFFFAFPITVTLVVVAWVWLQFQWLGIGFKHFLCCCRCCMKKTEEKKRQGAVVRKVIVDQYKALGPMRFAEKVVLGHFIVLVFLWLLRDPKFIPGWAEAFAKDYVKDAQAAIGVAVLLFIFPSEKPSWRMAKLPPPILDWDVMSSKFPWSIVILLGSGYALAKACEKSGLSQWVGGELTTLRSLEPWAIVLLVCLMITAFTEFTSNTATATIFLPILGSLAVNIGVHPWYLMLPAAIAASFAFMFPVATPPNAIVFASGQIRIPDMAKSGIVMNLLAVLVLVVLVNTYNRIVFDLGTFPAWADDIQTTTTVIGNVTQRLVCRNVSVPFS